MKDITFYAFLSNIKFFLSCLLKDPIETKVNDFLIDLGFTKQRLINILLKRDVIRRHEKIDDKEKESGNINYVVKYNVVRKQFERKIKRIYNKYVEGAIEKRDENIEEEATSCASSGQFSQPLFGEPIRRKTMYSESKQGRKRIFITEKQFEKLQEALTTSTAGDYGYDVPFPVKKNDPTMVHRKKGGISMDRLKK